MSRYGTDSSAPLRVLVVEDEPAEAELTIRKVRSIADLRTEIKHVETLAEAKSYLISNQADVILLDLELPNGRGLESLRLVRRIPRVPPIIVLTGADSEGDAIRAIAEEGAQSYIPKEVLTVENVRRILLYAVARHEYKLRELEAQRALYVTEAASERR